MRRLGPYQFTAASSPDQLEQVYRLNYKTFVSELGQYRGHYQKIRFRTSERSRTARPKAAGLLYHFVLSSAGRGVSE